MAWATLVTWLGCLRGWVAHHLILLFPSICLFCALSPNLPLGPGAVQKSLVSPPGTPCLNLKTQNSTSLWVFRIQADISASLAGPPLPV